MTKKTVLERFEEKYIPEPNSGCWLWIGADDNKGYGHIKVNGSTIKAHRLSFNLHKGEIPVGLHVLHTCDNPICVNPDHLFLGTHQDNMLDRQVKGRNPLTLYGEDNPAHKLTGRQILDIRNKYLPRKYSVRRLAKEYNVSFQLIQKIVTNQVWSVTDRH